jgi:uncharacterized membrane protein YadS
MALEKKTMRILSVAVAIITILGMIAFLLIPLFV